MSDPGSRDFWDWADLTVRILSGIAIPAILGYFGLQLRLEQDRLLKTEQVRSTIQHLASERWQERYMGVKVMAHYQDEAEGYPEELVSAIVAILNSEENPDVRRIAAKRFAEVDSLKKDTLDSAVRFYIHIGAEDQRGTARVVTDSLNGKLFGGDQPLDVLGTERLENLPSSTELRYFNPKQTDLANAIERYLEGTFGMEVQSSDLSDQFETIPDHFELWIPPN